MPSAEERFRAKVERRGDHDVWTGSRDARGAGLVRIRGKLSTAHRAAWEFAHGPVPAGARVLTCPAERACVRVEHLRLALPQPPFPPPQRTRPRRSRRGEGTKREVRPGVWELAVSREPGPGGAPRRHWERFHGTQAQAEARLALLAQSIRLPERFGDMRVRELLDRYLDWLDDRHPDTHITRWRQLADDVIEPAIGRQRAVLVDDADVFDFLRGQYRAGTTRPVLADVRALLIETWNWARQRRWTYRNPAATVALKDVT